MKAESSAGPGRRPDSLCLNHGGDGKAVPPAPVVNGDREEEASNLLDHAEELWLSSSQADRRKAVEAYKKLLSSFGDTEAVKKHKDRISGRSKKKLD